MVFQRFFSPCKELLSKTVPQLYSQTCHSLSSSAPSKKVVFLSQSENIFSNLAFEDWLFKNWDFKRRNLLFLWRNSPCVVIGKHQNPYREVNLEYLEKAGIPLARRLSGGGAVYHDLGNLNCTFFTSREFYDRKWNLGIIQKMLKENFDVDVQINTRDDITMGDNLKVSGSAAKLGREVAYHHCSLLFNTDHNQLSLTLKGDLDLQTNATESVRSKVGNISKSMDGMFPIVEVINKLAFQYLDTPSPSEKMYSHDLRQVSDGISVINPRDDWFPGLYDTKRELMSWDWLYGKSPKFSKTISVMLPLQFRTNLLEKLTFEFQVTKGCISNIDIPDLEKIDDDILRCVLEKYILKGMSGMQYNGDLSCVIDTMLRQPQPATGIL